MFLNLFGIMATNSRQRPRPGPPGLPRGSPLSQRRLVLSVSSYLPPFFSLFAAARLGSGWAKCKKKHEKKRHVFTGRAGSDGGQSGQTAPAGTTGEDDPGAAGEGVGAAGGEAKTGAATGRPQGKVERGGGRGPARRRRRHAGPAGPPRRRRPDGALDQERVPQAHPDAVPAARRLLGADRAADRRPSRTFFFERWWNVDLMGAFASTGPERCQAEQDEFGDADGSLDGGDGARQNSQRPRPDGGAAPAHRARPDRDGRRPPQARPDRTGTRFFCVTPFLSSFHNPHDVLENVKVKEWSRLYFSVYRHPFFNGRIQTETIDFNV